VADVKPTLIVFIGGLGGSPVAEMMAGAQRAIVCDILERAGVAGVFSRSILVTDRPGLVKWSIGEVVEEPAIQPFHFGQNLREITRKYNIDIPFYIGGGALPLAPSSRFVSLAQELESSCNLVITNNYYSSDMVAFTPGSAIDNIDLPSTDNPLARLLAETGLKQQLMPRDAESQFDVDTPTDLAILQLHPGIGPHTKAYLDSIKIDTSRLARAITIFKDKKAQILVAGRAGSHLWSQLEKRTACRVRFLSEERGLRADGREESGGGGSILGFYLQEVGPRRFFQDLARLGDAAFIDSRVIFHHLHLHPGQNDRFLSDLGEPDRIDDPIIREFTREAVNAPIPVILGGQSLVAGGFLALLEIADKMG